MPGPWGAMTLDQASADANASGYQMALLWCLRCNVGWAKAEVCWLCEKDDEVYRWGPSKSAFRFYPVKPRAQAAE